MEAHTYRIAWKTLKHKIAKSVQRAKIFNQTVK